jgi:tetratricopeptide (TPR) repeat protein
MKNTQQIQQQLSLSKKAPLVKSHAWINFKNWAAYIWQAHYSAQKWQIPIHIPCVEAFDWLSDDSGLCILGSPQLIKPTNSDESKIWIAQFLRDADLYISIGDDDKAVALLQRVLLLQIDNIKALNMLFSCKTTLSNKVVTQLLPHLNTQGSDIIRKLAQHFKFHKNYQTSLELIAQIEPALRSPNDFLLQAHCALHLGNFEDAKENLKQGLQYHSDAVSCALLLSKIYQHQHKYMAALRWVSHVLRIQALNAEALQLKRILAKQAPSRQVAA